MTAIVYAPLAVEWWAVRRAATPVVRSGAGPRRSLATAAQRRPGAVLVAGVAGGLHPDVRPGDLVVATEVRDPDGAALPCHGAPELAAGLRVLGLTVHSGPITSARKVVHGKERGRLAATGALAVDTESAWLAPEAGVPFAVVRAVVDTAAQPLLRPGTPARGLAALRALRAAVPAIDAWAGSAAPIDDGAGSGPALTAGPVPDLHIAQS